METKNSVLARQKDMQVSLEKVKGVVRLIQGISLPPLPDAPSEPIGIANGQTEHPSSEHTDCDSLCDPINGTGDGSTAMSKTEHPEQGQEQEQEEQEEEQEEQEKEALLNSTGTCSNLSKAPEPPQAQAIPPRHVEGAK